MVCPTCNGTSLHPEMANEGYSVLCPDCRGLGHVSCRDVDPVDCCGGDCQDETEEVKKE
jgi:hypothetical protein